MFLLSNKQLHIIDVQYEDHFFLKISWNPTKTSLTGCIYTETFEQFYTKGNKVKDAFKDPRFVPPFSIWIRLYQF